MQKIKYKKQGKIFFIFFMSLMIIWSLYNLIFGDSGVLDNKEYMQEKIMLQNAVEQAHTDVETMLQEYERLQSLSEPDQQFLMEQGRKLDDIIVYRVVVDEEKNLSHPPFVFSENIWILIAFSLFGLFMLLIILLIIKNHLENLKQSRKIYHDSI